MLPIASTPLVPPMGNFIEPGGFERNFRRDKEPLLSGPAGDHGTVIFAPAVFSLLSLTAPVTGSGQIREEPTFGDFLRRPVGDSLGDPQRPSEDPLLVSD